jgi:uncharacterized membrane protein
LAPGGARGEHGPTSQTKEHTVKIVTYGVMHFGVAFATAWALTGSVRIAGAIALVEPVVQTGAYALHERAWRRRDVWVARARSLRARLRHALAAMAGAPRLSPGAGARA